MATPRKHWFRVADSVAFEPWSNDVAATFTRLGGFMNSRWARDGKDATDGARITLRPADLMALTGSGSLTRARRIVRELATHVSLVVNEQGTNTLLEWPKFSVFQRYESRTGAEHETDPPPDLPSPQDAPARRKTQDSEQESKRPPAAPGVEQDPVALSFAADFRSALERVHEGFKPPTDAAFAGWCKQARLLLAERPEAEVRALARWLFDATIPSEAATFWRSVVLSVPKFREKFDQIAARRRGEEGRTNGRNANGPGTSPLAEAARAELRLMRLAGSDATG